MNLVNALSAENTVTVRAADGCSASDLGDEDHIAPRRVSPCPTEEALERAAGIFQATGDVARLRCWIS
jgi:hypothetical protein